MLDIAVALTALIAATPIMLMVALLVRASGGQVIFSQARVGHGGKTFRCYKFRTMCHDGDAVLARHLASHPAAKQQWETYRKLDDDPRVTALGELLRKSSLDELPQLYNVLRGDMSCVGPRPIMPDELDRYGANVEDYLAVKPGLTGLWQVSGRNSLTYNERVQLDSYYRQNWSLALDIRILARTVPAVLHFADTA